MVTWHTTRPSMWRREKKKDGGRRKRPLHLPPVISNRRSSRKRSPEESYLYAVGSPPAFRWTGWECKKRIKGKDGWTRGRMTALRPQSGAAVRYRKRKVCLSVCYSLCESVCTFILARGDDKQSTVVYYHDVCNKLQICRKSLLALLMTVPRAELVTELKKMIYFIHRLVRYLGWQNKYANPVIQKSFPLAVLPIIGATRIHYTPL